MLGEKILAAFKVNSTKVSKKIYSDLSSTNIITRRVCLRTFIGAAAGLYFLSFFSFRNDAKLVSYQPTLGKARRGSALLNLKVAKKPFLNAN